MLQRQKVQVETEVGGVEEEEQEEQAKLPTLDEFLDWGDRPNNSYLEEPGFSSLYVRKGQILVVLDGTFYRCLNTLTIAAVQAEYPGEGMFTRFVNKLVEKGLAVFVENVYNKRLQNKLLELGFKRTDRNDGLNFLYNHEEHIVSVSTTR